MCKPIALILLNWNTKTHTENCINSLYKYADLALFDIILADNGSSDGSLAYLQTKFPNIIYLDNEENLGFAEGNNKALELSNKKGYHFSMLLNTDTIVENDVIKELYNFLINNEQIAAVQPAIYYLHQKDKLWNGELKFNYLLGLTYSKKKIPISPKEVEWITGCCFLIRNRVLTDTGNFNAAYFLYYEDVELSFRIRSKGYQLYILPQSKIYHEAGVSGQKQNSEGTLSPIIHYYINRNRIWFTRKYGSRLFSVINYLIMAIYWIFVFSYFFFKGKKQKAKYLKKGILDGFLTSSN